MGNSTWVGVLWVHPAQASQPHHHICGSNKLTSPQKCFSKACLPPAPTPCSALDGLVPGGPLFESWLISFAAILMALHATLVSMNDELGYFRCPNASTSVAALAPAVRQRRTQLKDAFLRAKQVVALQQVRHCGSDSIVM